MQRSPSPALYYAIFFLSGISVMALSVCLPQLRPAVPDHVAANMLAAQFTGQLLGPFVLLRSIRLSLLTGLVLSAITAVLIAILPLPPLWLLLLYGLGMGIVMTATNLLAGEEAEPSKRASRIELLNAFWPLGAACASFCVGAVRRPSAAYEIIALLTLFALAALSLQRPSVEQTPMSIDAPTENAPGHLIRLAFLALLAVGLEAAVSNWAPAYSARLLGVPRAAFVASSLFWVGILSGRTAAAVLIGQFKASTFALLSAGISILATAALVLAHGPAVYAAIFLAAVGVAPIYPVIITRSLRLKGRSVMFATAGVGSAALPWLIGTVSSHAASLQRSMLIPIVTACVLFAALFFESRASMRETT